MIRIKIVLTVNRSVNCIRYAYTFYIVYAYEILHKNNDKKVTNCL